LSGSSPLLLEEGTTRPQENNAEGILILGADEVVRDFSVLTSPSARFKDASQLLLIAQPHPLYEEGTTRLFIDTVKAAPPD
jgi:hypothetical protein